MVVVVVVVAGTILEAAAVVVVIMVAMAIPYRLSTLDRMWANIIFHQK